MSVELPADAAAWVLRYQLPADGLVSAGSNILVAFCFLGCFLGSFLGCFLGCASSSALRGSAAGFWLPPAGGCLLLLLLLAAAG